MKRLELRVDKKWRDYLTDTKFNRYPDISGPETKYVFGACYRYDFQNGFGASVIKHPGSYGYEEDLWEIGLLKKEPNGKLYFCDDYPITEYGVVGHCTDERIGKLLELIFQGLVDGEAKR